MNGMNCGKHLWDFNSAIWLIAFFTQYAMITYPSVYHTVTSTHLKLKCCNWATILWPALLYWIRSIVTYDYGNE